MLRVTAGILLVSANLWKVGRAGTVSSGFGLVGSGNLQLPGVFILSDVSLRKTTVRARRELTNAFGAMRGYEARVERVLAVPCVWKVCGAREEVACVQESDYILPQEKVPLIPLQWHPIGCSVAFDRERPGTDNSRLAQQREGTLRRASVGAVDG